MAIVKLQNGNVLLKDGKVSCSCCAPVGCCMYPAQALIDGLYTVDDLPDEVLFNDGSRPPTILQKTLDPELVGGVGYPWPEDGSDDSGIYFIVINDGGDPITWAFGDDRGEGSFSCLIQGDGNLTPNNNLSEDQFADSYNISGVGTAIRESLCVWRYVPTSPEESIWIIEYGHPTFPYKFSVRSTVIGIYPKNGDQNTPAGTYGPGLVIS